MAESQNETNRVSLPGFEPIAKRVLNKALQTKLPQRQASITGRSFAMKSDNYEINKFSNFSLILL